MSEARQRWRVVFARDDEARYLSHLDAVTQWERAFRRGSIPVATTGGFNARPKLVFAAPLQLGMLAEHELADLFLDERLTAPALRTRLSAGMPAGYKVVDIHDVWMGAPALAPQLVAADYRMILFGVERGVLSTAAARLMDAKQLKRERRRESKTISYDLRPLLIDLRVRDAGPEAVAPAPGSVAPHLAPASHSGRSVSAAVATAPSAGLWMRLRHSQERGSGRADEVVAALADELGMATGGPGLEEGQAPDGELPTSPEVRPVPANASLALATALEMLQAVRERLWLADELGV